MNIVKDAMLALESIETIPAAEPITQNTPITPAAVLLQDAAGVKTGQTTPDEEQKIVMNGPLSTIYARALNIAFARQDQATGDYAATTKPVVDVPAVPAGTKAALESQSNDYINAAIAMKERSTNYPKDGTASGTAKGIDDHEPQDTNTILASSTSGVRAVRLQPDEIIPIFNRPEEFFNQPVEFIFYTDATQPTATSPMGEGRQCHAVVLGDNWNTALESVAVVIKLKSHPSEATLESLREELKK